MLRFVSNTLKTVYHNHTLLAPLAQQQVRGKKKKKRDSRNRYRAPVFESHGEAEKFFRSLKTLTFHEYLEKKRNKRKKKPAYRDIILTRTWKFGFEGEQIRLKAPLANHIVLWKRAVFDTPENRRKYVESKGTEYHKKIEELRYFHNKRWFLNRAAIYIRRKIDDPRGIFLYPITAKDVCDKIWVHSKILVKPEQVLMPNDQPIRKPGMYSVFVDVGDDEENPAGWVRIYAKRGSDMFG